MGDLIANTDNPFDMAEEAILSKDKGNSVIDVFVGEQLPEGQNYQVRVELGMQSVVHTLHLDPRYCSTLSPLANQVREELSNYNDLVEKYRDGIIPHLDAYTQTPRVWSAPRSTQTLPTPMKTKAIHITQTILIDTAPDVIEINTTLIPDDNMNPGAASSHSRPGTSNSQHSVNSTASLAKSGEDGNSSIAGSVVSVARTNDTNDNAGNSDAASDTGTVMTMMTTVTTMTTMTTNTTMTAGSLNSLGSLVDTEDGEAGDNIGTTGYGEGQGFGGVDPEIQFLRLCSRSQSFLASLLLAEDILNQTLNYNLYSEYDGRDIVDMINKKIDEFSNYHIDAYMNNSIQDVTTGTYSFANEDEYAARAGEANTNTNLEKQRRQDITGQSADQMPMGGAMGENYSLDFIQLPVDDMELFYTAGAAKGSGNRDSSTRRTDTGGRSQSKHNNNEVASNYNYQLVELHSLWDFYTPGLAGMTVTAVQFAPCYDGDPASLTRYIEKLRSTSLQGINKPNFLSSNYINKLRHSFNNIDPKTPLLAVGYASSVNSSLLASMANMMNGNGANTGDGGAANSQQQKDPMLSIAPPDLGLLVVWYRNPQRPFNVFTLRSGVTSIAWQPESPGMIAVGTRKGEVSIFMCKSGIANISVSTLNVGGAGVSDKDHDAAGFSIPAMSTSSSGSGGCKTGGGSGGGMGGSGGAGGAGGMGMSGNSMSSSRGRHIGAVWGLGWTRSSTNEKDKDKDAKSKAKAAQKKKNLLHQNDDDDSSINTDLLLSISADGKVIERSLKRNLEFHEILQLMSSKSHPASNSANTGVGGGGNTSSVSRRLACGTALAVSLVDPGTYLLGTDSGSIHRASRTYTEQYLDTYDGNGHTNTVSSIEWCPFAIQDIFSSCSATEGSVKIWSTEGNDAVYTLVADSGVSSGGAVLQISGNTGGNTGGGHKGTGAAAGSNASAGGATSVTTPGTATTAGGSSTNNPLTTNRQANSGNTNNTGGTNTSRLVNTSGTRLTCMSWCPFSPTILLTGSSSGVVAVWDMSVSLMTPVFQMNLSEPSGDTGANRNLGKNGQVQMSFGKESVTCITFSNNSPTVAVGMSSGRVVILRVSGIETSIMWKRLLPQEVLERGYERIHSLMTSSDE